MPRTYLNSIPNVTHPSDYTGYPFMSLIVYRKQMLLCVIECTKTHRLRAYVVDFFTELAVDWYENHQDIPISIYITQKGHAAEFSEALVDMVYSEIERIIGPVFSYDFCFKTRTKKKQRKDPSPLDLMMENAYTEAFG